MNVLDLILEGKRREFPPSNSLQDIGETRSKRNDFKLALKKNRLSIIGEIKPKSPSMGELATGAKLEALLSSYEKHCAAISVLTDRHFFGGSFELLASIAKRTRLPVICKDFIVSEQQIALARKAGAQAILLVVKVLSLGELKTLIDAAVHHGLEPVVEVNSESEIALLDNLPVDTVLINNRNLTTMQVDLATTERLANLVPKEKLLISASGVSTQEDILRLAPHTNCFLIGTALMKSSNPEELLRSFHGATGSDTKDILPTGG